MIVYATVDEYILRYGELTVDEASKVEMLLSDASAIVQVEGGKTEELTEPEKAVYRGVVCDMVNSFVTQENWGDVSQRTQTAGSFTESISFRTPPGTLRLTIPQRKLLGLSSMVIGSIPPTYEGRL